MVIETASNGAADALVTYNTGDFLAAAGRFPLAVFTPSEFLKRMRP
jgi:predicted nucleic acid-binding protein